MCIIGFRFLKKHQQKTVRMTQVQKNRLYLIIGAFVAVAGGAAMYYTGSNVPSAVMAGLIIGAGFMLGLHFGDHKRSLVVREEKEEKKKKATKK
jgi:hypothetical protein